jgi:ankyrin repeat protein
MNRTAFFCHYIHSQILRLVVISFIMPACIIPVFCDPIHDAARNGDLRKVKALLKDHPDLVSSKDSNLGGTPLHWAAISGRKDVAQWLLSMAAEVNARDANFGRTPLHWAAENGYRDVAELLLANKAAINGKDDDGKTPLHCAASYGALEFWKTDINAKTNTGNMLSQSAASVRNREVIEMLLTKGAEVNTRDKNGNTPLHTAALFGPKGVAELLLAKGAEINASNRIGKTPLHCAVDHKDIMELLLANKADVNAKDKDGRTPMQWAVSLGKDGLRDYRGVIELLRRHGGHE